jgi:hypothetical protein
MVSRCSIGLGMTRGRGIPCDPPVLRGGGWREHRILETCDRILTECCGGVSASPEHNAVAARHRLRVNYPDTGFVYLGVGSRTCTGRSAVATSTTVK